MLSKKEVKTVLKVKVKGECSFTGSELATKLHNLFKEIGFGTVLVKNKLEDGDALRGKLSNETVKIRIG